MSSKQSSQKGDSVLQRNEKNSCNCGWEVRFGRGVAVTLAIFEGKRFFMLMLEIFAEWQVIRFAGGMVPVILTLVNISLGLPTALATVRTIRRRSVPRCCEETKRALRVIILMVTVCAAMNGATLISIGCHMSVRQDALIDIFNASMSLYAKAVSYKYAIDEIQFIFQCCGHTSYMDWFNLDWQKVDFSSREGMTNQRPIQGEGYKSRSVPFSCCDLRAMTPCIHVEILRMEVHTINRHGCVKIIYPVLLRIIIVAYVMTSTLVITQVLLTFLLTKIYRKLSMRTCRLYYLSTDSTEGSVGVHFDNTSSERRHEPRCTRKKKKQEGRRTRKAKRGSAMKCTRFRYKNNLKRDTSNSSSSSSQFDSLLAKHFSKQKNSQIRDMAKIRPSAHEEHTISKKLLRDTENR